MKIVFFFIFVLAGCVISWYFEDVRPKKRDNASRPAWDPELTKLMDYTAGKIAREFGKDGYMYQMLRRYQISYLMLVIGDGYSVRINVESDTSKLYDELPKAVWERDYSLREMMRELGMAPGAVSLPLTNHERLELHKRIQRALLSLPHIALKEYRELHAEYRYSDFYISFD